MKIDPEFRDLIPPLADDEKALLEASLLADGCRDPLVVWRDTLVDGHHRHAICEAHGLAYQTSELARDSRDDVLRWIIDHQRGRRNLTPADRIILGKKYLEIEARAARARKAESGKAHGRGREKVCQTSDTSNAAPKAKDRADDRAAAAVGVSRDTLRKGLLVLEEAPERVEAIRRGESTINAEHKEIVRKKRNAKAAAARAQKIEEIAARAADPAPSALPRLYPVILADPPWRYEHVATESRAIENQYPTMDLAAICNLDVPAAGDAVLYLWATAPKLAEALRVVTAWGFEYRTCAVWVKDKIGMGYWVRQRHELLLIAVRGTMPPPPESARRDSVIEAPRGRHSAKPAAVYDMIEAAYTELPKLELFARTPRPGWDAWGNEIGGEE